MHGMLETRAGSFGSLIAVCSPKKKKKRKNCDSLDFRDPVETISRVDEEATEALCEAQIAYFNRLTESTHNIRRAYINMDMPVI